MLEKIKRYFNKNEKIQRLNEEVDFLQSALDEIEEPKGTMADLTRENLGLITVDFVHQEKGVPNHFLNLPDGTDGKAKRDMYIGQLAQIYELEVWQAMIKNLIDTQGNYTLRIAKDDMEVFAGRMQISGISLVRDEVKNGYEEYMDRSKPKEEFDPTDHSSEGVPYEKEIEAYTPEEFQAAKAESEKAIAASKAELEVAKKETERLSRHISEQKDNFKKLNEMTAEEKAQYSVKEMENVKRVEAAEARAKALEDKVNEDVKNRINSDKERALAKYHGGDKTLKESLEKNFNMINLVGDTTDIIEERARLAANMEKGRIGSVNPLRAPLNGAAPSVQRETTKEEFFKSEKGQRGAKLMGLEDNKKK